MNSFASGGSKVPLGLRLGFRLRVGFRLGLLLALLLPLGFGCKRRETAPPPEPSLAQDRAPAPTSPDRLPPGELLEGELRLFDLPLPRSMSIESQTRHTAEAKGPVRAEALSEYIRARVLVNHVEIADGRVVFPEVKLRGDTSGKALRLEVVAAGPETRLLVVYLASRMPVQGLSEDERWRRAGMKPTGELIDPNSLE